MKTILVVDDERDIVEIVSEILQGKGFRTLQAYNGQEAIDALNRHAPDGIVLDLKMPVVDGIGVIRYMRSSAPLAQTPVIVLTATQVIQEAQEQFKQLGVFRWMTKPFEPEELCAAVVEAVEELPMARERILVVDDEADIRDVLRITLEAEGYDVYEAINGEDAIVQVQKSSPQLILLDFKMPRMEGPEVCHILKKDILLQHLPIIMLTSKGEIMDKVHGIDAGADDYMVKPFDPIELLARVKMILRRTARTLDANPLTKLPGNVSILEELQARVDNGGPTAVCYIDLDQFKAFNDTYGFERGDELIKATARILLASLRELGTPGDFLGHIGGDDFVLITHPSAAENLCRQIVTEFKKAAPEFYSQTDRKKGYIEAVDRDGKPRQFPMMTLSIAVVTNEQRPLKRVAEIAQIGAELKEWVKKQEKIRWVKDRRGE